jgi:hypothetical protein
MTIFLAILTVDGKRIQQNRADIAFCKIVKEHKEPRKELVRSLFKKYYVPFLFNKKT